MITVTVADCNNFSTFQERSFLESCPAFLRIKIQKFVKAHDRRIRTCGYSTLKDICTRYDADFSSLSTQEFGKPAIDGFKFNISHSGDIVVIAHSSNNELGIDIEKKEPISYHEFSACFTADEWNSIQQGGLESFYQLWTAKEACLKANGSGFQIDPASINTLGSPVTVQNTLYYTKYISVAPTYTCCIASTSIEAISLETEFPEKDAKRLCSRKLQRLSTEPTRSV